MLCHTLGFRGGVGLGLAGGTGAGDFGRNDEEDAEKWTGVVARLLLEDADTERADDAGPGPGPGPGLGLARGRAEAAAAGPTGPFRRGAGGPVVGAKGAGEDAGAGSGACPSGSGTGSGTGTGTQPGGRDAVNACTRAKIVSANGLRNARSSVNWCRKIWAKNKALSPS